MIDIKRVKRLRNGAEYRNYATDAGGPYTIHGAYRMPGATEWDVISHRVNSRHSLAASNFDLIEEPVVESAPSPPYRRRKMNTLSKREYFAAMAMQGMLANSYSAEDLKKPLSFATSIEIAEMAVDQADELLRALEQTTNEEKA